MTVLPNDLESYRKTEIFTEETVPAGLLRAHNTKPGTWALIHVVEGRLLYRVTDERAEPSERVLTPGEPPGVVEPTVPHEVRPLGPVRFQVEFFRRRDSSE